MNLTATQHPADRFRPDQYQCARCGIIHDCTWDQKPTHCQACQLTAQRDATLPDQAWVEQALCAQTGPDEFFTTKGGTNRAAKAVCARCDVTAECLAFALATGQEHGVWGGLSAFERRGMDAQSTVHTTVGGAA